MSILRFFESIRNPFLDTFFSLVTKFGEETLFILLGLLFFWCINKKQGYYILFIGFLGTVVNQFLKLWFRIPRPWVKDETFTIVESARAEATGYSFPSGHTQTAVGNFGAVARARSEKWLKVVCIILCVLVPISRMYLGVHTPADVLVSLLVATVLVFLLYPVLGWAMSKKKNMRVFIGIMTAIAAAYLLFVELYSFPADIDLENFESGLKNGYKILGCILGIWLAYEVDEGYTHFDTKGSFWVQVLKLAVGLLPVLGIKALLKQPLYDLCGGLAVADGIRYFLIAGFAGAVWPMTFKWFAKIDRKKQVSEENF